MHDLCFVCFFKNHFDHFEINLTTRGPLYTLSCFNLICLVGEFIQAINVKRVAVKILMSITSCSLEIRDLTVIITYFILQVVEETVDDQPMVAVKQEDEMLDLEQRYVDLQEQGLLEQDLQEDDEEDELSQQDGTQEEMEVDIFYWIILCEVVFTIYFLFMCTFFIKFSQYLYLEFMIGFD